MGGTSTGVRRRSRGSVGTLPSGSLRVRVYAGTDVVTKKDLYLTEVIPPGPQAENLAEQARLRLVAEIAEDRHPRTDATISYRP